MINSFVQNMGERLRLSAAILGLAVLFISERFLDDGKVQLGLTIAGIILQVAAIGLAIAFSMRAQKRGHREEARTWGLCIFWQGLLLLSLGLYFAYVKAVGNGGVPSTFGQKALLAGWLLTCIFAVATAIGTELALFSSGRGEVAEYKRVARAAASWLLVGMGLACAIALNFVAFKKDRSFDISYTKTTEPGESTIKMVKSLNEDMTIAAFLPVTHPARPYVEPYFSRLTSEDPHLHVEYLDKDLMPTRAETYHVSLNGQIIVDFKGKHERIDLGQTLISARNVLKKFDGEFQKAFLAVSSAQKVIYLSQGHDEISAQGQIDDPLRSLKGIDGMMRKQNYAVRNWGLTEGSGKEVPEDASAVLIMGGTRPFATEEVAALKAYLQRGGKLMVFFDRKKDELTSIPGRGSNPLLDLIAECGIEYHDDLLVNDKQYVVAFHNTADKAFLATGSFASHDSVMTLARHDEQLKVLAFNTGYLVVKGAQGDWKASETIRTLGTTFVDLNRNYIFDDATEKRGTYSLGAASVMTKAPTLGGTAKPGSDGPQEARVLVYSSASMLADPMLQSAGNIYLAADGLKWLLGDSKFAGEVKSEEDVKIQHTKDQDNIWFMTTVAGVPCLVLAAGFFATRRRKKATQEEAHAA